MKPPPTANQVPPSGPDNGPHKPISPELIHALRNQYQALNAVRRGVCLLSAGRFAEAEESFNQANQNQGAQALSPTYIAACLLGKKRPVEAAEQFSKITEKGSAGTAARIRQALALRSAGRMNDAITILRDTVAADPNQAESHFQLGTLLSICQAYDEAELRFTQAVNLDPNHVEAMVSLALCCGVRGGPGAALRMLEKAQGKKPHDGRIGFLLAQAAKAVQDRGQPVKIQAVMPCSEPAFDADGIKELAGVIAAEPDFVDAFLAIPSGEVDESVFGMLLRTLEAALEREPEHAELHYHCGRVLARLGNPQAAIEATERAVGINPRFLRALIELGRLYQQTDRTADATTRLEQAVSAGADYADVHFLLGNLYRDQGDMGLARVAYRRALMLNQNYTAAQEALATLPG